MMSRFGQSHSITTIQEAAPTKDYGDVEQGAFTGRGRGCLLGGQTTSDDLAVDGKEDEGL